VRTQICPVFWPGGDGRPVPEPPQPELFPPESAPTDVVAVNARCLVRTRDGHRAVLVAGVPIAHYAIDDAMAEAYAMVQLVAQGWADQIEVARAFGRSERSVRRYQRRFEDGGLTALGRPGGFPNGRSRIDRSRDKCVGKLRAEGKSLRQIADTVGVSEKAIRKQLRRLGWPPAKPAPVQIALPIPAPAADPNLSGSADAPGEPAAPAAAAADPNLSGSAAALDDEPLVFTADRNPADRWFDRLLAKLGMIEDAAPLFRDGERVPRAGVLLALPAIAQSGVVEIAREVYGSIGPAFYGLRTTMVALVFLALLRIKRPEALKEHAPPDLGRLLGLDRAPEVKTLRRKLTRLAGLARATEFGRRLAERRVQQFSDAMGFLYVDGHVRAYHGTRELPKTHVARMRIAMPATTDYWVNDAAGEPLFVVTAEANAGLVKMLPELCKDIRGLVGERRVTIVFDRGGWSPKLFAKLIADGFDILTYRKGRARKRLRWEFREHRATLDGRDVVYKLADHGIRLLGGKLELREVVRLSDDGSHQTQVVTSRRDLPAIEVAYRMFERWRQENFFKYLRDEYALDALVDYQLDPADPQRDVPNPARAKLDTKLRAARAEVIALSARYGIEAMSNRETQRRTMRGFKIANATLARPVKEALRRYAALEARRAKVPRRIPVGEVVDGDVVKLAVERKHLTDVVKMVAYQAETDLVRRIVPHYKRADDEARTLAQSMLANAGDIVVTRSELRVTFAPLSSPHRTAALAALCTELDALAPRFPGTRLRVRYAVAGPKPDSSGAG
jgi:DNA-binding CsgD family transcriptional regulator